MYDQFLQKYPILYSKLSGFDCNKGWYKLIEELSQKIEEINLKFANPEHKIYAVQVKQKFGGLRFYTEISDSLFDDEEQQESVQQIVYDLITIAETKSYTICEDCGLSGTITKNRAYVETLCEKCLLK
jgi:methionine synthase II (cobalamin-independent)